MNNFDYLQIGICKASSASYEEAIHSFNQVLKGNSFLVDAHYNRGMVYLKMGYHMAAIEDFNQVLNEFSRNSDALPIDLQVSTYCYQGQAYYYLCDHFNALKSCNQALNLDFYCAQAYQERGLIQLEIGWNQEALEDLQTSAYLNLEQGRLFAHEQTEDLINLLFYF